MAPLRLAEQLVQDIRYALRTMAGRPLFTAMAVLSLALGIGANTAIYSFMDSILMRAIPVHDPESLVVLNWHAATEGKVMHSFSGSTYDDGGGITSPNLPWGAFEDFSAKSGPFATIFGFSSAGRLTVQVNGDAGLAQAQYVTGTFFSGLGVPPAAGRLIDATDDRANATPVAVVSYSYAQKRFGDAAKAAGASVLLNNTPFTIIGVTPPEFFGVNPGNPQELYVSMSASPLLDKIFGGDQTKFTNRNYYWVQMMARLKRGATREAAESVAAAQFQSFVEGTVTKPEERENLPKLHLQDGAGGLDGLRRQYAKPLYVLMTMVGLILAIACANIANLLLARAAGRRREMALRLSLGAARGRVIRQLLTESVMLAGIGGVLGIVFAKWGISGLTVLIANGRDNFTLNAALNWRVLAMTAGLSLLTGVIFGLAPALQSTRVDLITALKQSRAGESGGRRGWLRINATQGLIVAQISVSLLLVLAAGLFVRTLNNLNSIQIGFNRENLTIVQLNANQAGYKDEGLMRFYANMRQQFAAIPGVRNATFSNYPLVSGSRNATNVAIPGQEARNSTAVMNVGADFFTTLQLPLLLGRDIQERDTASKQGVGVVNEMFAKTFFGHDNPIGRHVLLSREKVDLEIVGVCKTTPLSSLKREASEVLYVPYNQFPRQSLGTMNYELRAAGDPAGLAEAVRRIVRQTDAHVPIWGISTQSRVIDQTIGQERTFAFLCTCFAGLALAIAFVGLYGTMAYTVARRTSEIGIRMALGAQRRRLIWMILRDVLVMAAAGLAIGIPVAYASGHVVESFLFKTKANDPTMIAVAAIVLVAAAMVAGYGPAWRASRVDPWIALRDE